MSGAAIARVTSRVRHENVKMIEVVKGAGIDGGDMIVVEEDSPSRLLTINRYRMAARVTALIIDGEGRWQQDGFRVAFEPMGGVYPRVLIEFCPVCEETVVLVKVWWEGQERPAESSQVSPAK